MRLVTLMLFLLYASVGLTQEYRLPTGVTVFSESRIFDHLVGNTAQNKMFVEFYLPPVTGEMQGVLRGRSEVFGDYTGSWRINGKLFCIQYDKRIMSSRSDCYTVAVNGENTRIYRMDGFELYPDGGRLVVVKGNPVNL